MGPQKVETMRRPRPERGERRIDAAIDHLAQYGFAKPQIRKVINDLLQLYGRDGWVFLEEGSYSIVLKVLEEQAQQDQTQEAAAAEEALPQNGMEVSRVNGEAPNEPPSTLELQASPSSSPLLLVPPAKGPPCARTPCYGWISEESESESESEDGEMLSDVTGPVIFAKKDIPNPVGTLPSRRK
ncbi:uncharacterized protein [Zea mays]|uniref:WIYLD domain-containing protein n=2 Tax=Zea mays TaxID=4577 RepID=A0A1D6KWU6_MAIZE|nr:uncharacterized protein LOC100193162 isoform X2 [Zea mays]XP_035816668.1 uncharacterized protein LOC100193162 isoform X2 [Zea mays]ONM06939.1 hypothetical protein ZEAMMB73_Zm00001d033190 [Zea mays]ONM06940.1 hypothetical protein ZEAMMB73_Zm00001d033190 [Zea mays]ONM06941.1 hypothetical protein ZEAMMB73_Zm00001d033190 [Zea mays]|eukprot:XP_020396086.1 uncharacterized protein LOC100193162 isoform X2 [Zea mays]